MLRKKALNVAFFVQKGLYPGNYSNDVCQKHLLQVALALPKKWYKNISVKSERIEKNRLCKIILR